MKITSIEPQTRRKKRFNIYVDGEFFCGLSQETIIRKSLKIGQKLTKKSVEKLLFEDQYSKAFNKALRFLGYRMRTKKEIKNKLEEKDFHPKIIEKVIKELKKENLLNDKEFARSWIRTRKALKPSGTYMIKKELQQKGISNAIIKEVIDKELSEEEQLKIALNAALKKKPIYQKLPKREFNQKISQFLARRGFPWNIIKKVLDKIKD